MGAAKFPQRKLKLLQLPAVPGHEPPQVSLHRSSFAARGVRGVADADAVAELRGKGLVLVRGLEHLDLGVKTRGATKRGGSFKAVPMCPLWVSKKVI